MVSCSSLSVCCHFCFLSLHSRQLLPDPVTGSLTTLLYWVCIFKKYSNLICYFVVLGLDLYVFSFPCLWHSQCCPCLHWTKIITQETFPPIRRGLASCLWGERPVRIWLTSPGPDRLAWRAEPSPGWGLRVSSMFYKCWHNSVSGSHASTEVSSVFFISTLW